VSEPRKVQLQPAYVLHHRPYRDTSRILELFTRDYGRVSVFARGAREKLDAATAQLRGAGVFVEEVAHVG